MRESRPTIATATIKYQQAICDLCKAEIPPGKHVEGSWREGQPIYKVKFQREQNSTNFGDHSIDLCGPCWHRHFLAVLRQQNCAVADMIG